MCLSAVLVGKRAALDSANCQLTALASLKCEGTEKLGPHRASLLCIRPSCQCHTLELLCAVTAPGFVSRLNVRQAMPQLWHQRQSSLRLALSRVDRDLAALISGGRPWNAHHPLRLPVMTPHG